MRDVVLTVAGGERNCAPAWLHISVAILGDAKHLVQALHRAGVVWSKLATARARQNALRQHSLAARIGMHNPSAGIHKEETGADPIESIAERCGFGRRAMNEPADEHGPAHMRNDQPQALPHRVVHDAAVALAQE